MKKRDDLIHEVAVMLLRACESPSGRLRPWKPFDVTQLAREIVEKVLST